MRLDPYLTPHTKTNSKQIEDLDFRATTIKLLEEHTGAFFMTLGQRWFLGCNTESTGNERKTDKLDFTKFSNFCASKGLYPE